MVADGWVDEQMDTFADTEMRRGGRYRRVV